MIGAGAGSSTGLLSLAGWPDDGFGAVVAAEDGFAVLAATDVGLRGFISFGAAAVFTFAVAGLAVNGAGLSSTGGSASAILLKQPGAMHPSRDASCGVRQLQPIKVVDNKPTRSILI
jgi:hypothetical protein